MAESLTTNPHPQTRSWMLLLPVLLGWAVGLALPAAGQEKPEASPFADPDMTPSSQARCSELRRLTRDVEAGSQRIDLSVFGTLTLVHFDGVLAYLGLCAPPDPRVLCVTYSTNDLEAGDTVIVSGGYSRPDADSILLDPCLASPPDPQGNQPAD